MELSMSAGDVEVDPYASTDQDVPNTKVNEVSKLRIAKLGLSLAALCGLDRAVGDQWCGMLRAVIVLVVVGFLASTVGVRDLDLPKLGVWSRLGWREEEKGEEEKTSKAMEHKTRQDARGNEPAQGWPREHEPGHQHLPRDGQGHLEPGRFGETLRDDEPNISKVELRDSFDDHQVPRFWDYPSGRPVSGRSRNVVGEGGSVCDPKSTHYCPSSCPGSSFPEVDGAIAMDSTSTGRLKIAAVRVDNAGAAGEDEPWKVGRFVNPPSHGKDCWIDVLLDRGWLVRAHSSERVRKMHPIHRSIPVDPKDLTIERVTVGFDREGNRLEIRDQWTNPGENLFCPKKPWKGWSFFRLKSPMVVNRLLVRPFTESTEFRDQEIHPRHDGGERGAVDECDVARSSRSVSMSTESPGLVRASSRSQGSSEAASTYGRGYMRGAVAEKGRAVSSQLPIAPVVSHTQDRPVQTDFDDEDEWERVDESEEEW